MNLSKEIEHELIQTLGHVHAIESVTWDSLGELIVIQATVGKDSKPLSVPVSIEPKAARELIEWLRKVLEAKATEEAPTRQ